MLGNSYTPTEDNLEYHHTNLAFLMHHCRKDNKAQK